MMTSCLGSRLVLLHIRFENATCGRRFLINTKKKSSVFENTQLVWTVKYDSKTLRVDAAYI